MSRPVNDFYRNKWIQTHDESRLNKKSDGWMHRVCIGKAPLHREETPDCNVMARLKMFPDNTFLEWFLSVQRFLSERRREWSIVLFQLPAKRQKELVDPKLIRILFVVHKAPHISAFSRGLLDFGCLYYTMVLRFLVLFLQILYHSYACLLLIMPF